MVLQINELVPIELWINVCHQRNLKEEVYPTFMGGSTKMANYRVYA